MKTTLIAMSLVLLGMGGCQQTDAPRPIATEHDAQTAVSPTLRKDPLDVAPVLTPTESVAVDSTGNESGGTGRPKPQL